MDFTKRERGVYRPSSHSAKMTQGQGIFIAYCDACLARKRGTKRIMVAEIKLSSGRIIRLCKECLRESLERLHASDSKREKQDKEGVRSQRKASQVLKQGGIVGYVEP